jgi:hypothetical protein
MEPATEAAASIRSGIARAHDGTVLAAIVEELALRIRGQER